jgi:hypothetical protein
MCVYKLRLNQIKRETWYNTNHILMIDCKTHNNNMIKIFETSNKADAHKTFSYIPYLFPWNIDKRLDDQIGKLIDFKRSVFNYTVGI